MVKNYVSLILLDSASVNVRSYPLGVSGPLRELNFLYQLTLILKVIFS